MKINGDEVERVQCFAELRPGLLVWADKCRCPAGRHRGMLLSPVEVLPAGIAFPLEPQPACALVADPSMGPFSVAADAVELGCVYRIVEPERAPAPARREKAKVST